MSFMENEISDIIRANNRHLVQVALEACKYTSFSSYISLYTLKTHRAADWCAYKVLRLYSLRYRTFIHYPELT